MSLRVRRATAADVERLAPLYRAAYDTAAGDLVGAIRVLEESDVPFLERVAVAPDAQGEGIGSRLFARAERYAREAGYDRVRLGTFTDHPFLLDFYESRGYERFTLWESDDYEHDYVGYEKRI